MRRDTTIPSTKGVAKWILLQTVVDGVGTRTIDMSKGYLLVLGSF